MLVATDIAAKGLDFPDIQHVINFDMPGTCTCSSILEFVIVCFGVYVMILCDWIYILSVEEFEYMIHTSV